MKQVARGVTAEKTATGFLLHRDPLAQVRASRVSVAMNTGTRVEKPKKGKGSYARRPKHRLPDA